jgi:hypothetical protein
MKPSSLRQWATLILQVCAGQLTATEAARQLGVSRKTYYQWEARALRSLMQGLRPGRPGRPCVFRRHSDTDSDFIRTGFRRMSDSVPEFAGQCSGDIRTAIRDGPDSVPDQSGHRSGVSGQFFLPP